MTLTVRFTPRARSQFLDAIRFIRRDKPSAAARFKRKAEVALRRLEAFPDTGRSLPEFPELPFREVIVPPYRFFYATRGGTVWVVAVWHGAQQPSKPSPSGE